MTSPSNMAWQGLMRRAASSRGMAAQGPRIHRLGACLTMQLSAGNSRAERQSFPASLSHFTYWLGMYHSRSELSTWSASQRRERISCSMRAMVANELSSVCMPNVYCVAGYSCPFTLSGVSQRSERMISSACLGELPTTVKLYSCMPGTKGLHSAPKQRATVASCVASMMARQRMASLPERLVMTMPASVPFLATSTFVGILL